MTADHTPTTDTDTTALIKQILTAAIAAPEQVGPALGDAFARFLNGERARVLREAADALERATCEVKRTCHKADAITLRMRADRIERGEQP